METTASRLRVTAGTAASSGVLFVFCYQTSLKIPTLLLPVLQLRSPVPSEAHNTASGLFVTLLLGYSKQHLFYKIALVL